MLQNDSSSDERTKYFFICNAKKEGMNNNNTHARQSTEKKLSILIYTCNVCQTILNNKNIKGDIFSFKLK
jgi:hypothetical protein